MSRVGWVVLGLIGLAAAAFLSMTSFGVAHRSGAARTVPASIATIHMASLQIPVSGVTRAMIHDNWGEARGGGTRAHHGTDIPAPAGAVVVAAAAGVIEKLFQSRNGGTTLYVRSPDWRWSYYYAHLAGYAPGVREGMRVSAGESLGYVGDTGDAGAGNYHLHFGLAHMRPEDRWWQGVDVNPYPLLAAGRVPG